MNLEILKADEDAIAAMKDNGLTINPVSEDAKKQWQKMAETGLSKIEGKSFQANYRNMVQQYLDEFRKSQ